MGAVDDMRAALVEAEPGPVAIGVAQSPFVAASYLIVAGVLFACAKSTATQPMRAGVAHAAAD